MWVVQGAYKEGAVGTGDVCLSAPDIHLIFAHANALDTATLGRHEHVGGWARTDGVVQSEREGNRLAAGHDGSRHRSADHQCAASLRPRAVFC